MTSIAWTLPAPVGEAMAPSASLGSDPLMMNWATQETPIQFLGQEDPLEKEMATHSSILAWRIPWTEEPGI